MPYEEPQGPEAKNTVMRTLEKPFRRLRNQIFRVMYQGRGCYCVYCGKTYRKFLHHGVRAEVFRRHRISGSGYRKNARCPNCGSTHRTRLLHLFFELRTDIETAALRVLHVSPKRQLARVLLRHENIDYVCGALFPDDFADLNAVKVDVRDMGFPDQHFHVVICNHVLEHVREDETAMREIHRILKTGGYAILQVPLAHDLATTREDPSVVGKRERKAIYGQKDHLRLYGLDYFERLEQAGFEVERDNPFDNQWLPNLERHCLDELEDVIVAHKR